MSRTTRGAKDPKGGRAASEHEAEPDLVAELLNDWSRERPDLDAGAMGIVGRVIRLGGELRSSASHALRPFDLHYTDFDVLATLRRSGHPYRLTPTELRRAVLLTSGAMTASLGRLERKGLLTRSDDPSDGRVRAVVLTEEGLQLVDQAVVARFEDAARAIEGLRASDRKTLERLLRDLSLMQGPTV